MADTSTKQHPVPPCPCCTFLSEDLFLPSPPQRENDDVRTDDTEENHSNTASTGNPTNVNVPSPQQALELLQRIFRASSGAWKDSTLLLVDTHNHAHLNRPTDDDSKEQMDDNDNQQHTDDDSTNMITFVSLSCSIQQADWTEASRYASQSQHRLPAFGIHPWYLKELVADTTNWLSDLETRLNQHPRAIVGEIGLCQKARFLRQYEGGKSAALQLQRTVFTQQLQLAARLNRPVSVHCVQQHGVFFSILQELLSNNNKSNTAVLPPIIAMHSFTGTAHHVQQLMRLEETHSNQTRFYFGFSYAINHAMCSSEKSRRKGREAVRAVPKDRLLAESDLANDEQVVAGTAGSIAYLAWALDEPLLEVALLVARNGLAFLNGGNRKSSAPLSS